MHEWSERRLSCLFLLLDLRTGVDAYFQYQDIEGHENELKQKKSSTNLPNLTNNLLIHSHRPHHTFQPRRPVDDGCWINITLPLHLFLFHPLQVVRIAHLLHLDLA